MKRYLLLLTIFIGVSCAVIAQSNTTNFTASNGIGYKIYPNPLTGDVLEVNFNLELKINIKYTFTITNILGQTVYSHSISDDEIKRGNFSIDVESLKLDKGIYLTKLSNGAANAIQKLVVR